VFNAARQRHRGSTAVWLRILLQRGLGRSLGLRILGQPARKWRLSDPQLDEIQRAKCRVDFDTIDVPRRAFLSAGAAWLECRAGRSDPSRFGQSQTTEPWFMMIDVIRDHYVANNRESSAWDSWRAAPLSARLVSERDAEVLDELAGCPERPLVELTADWLT
jgi:hypothetical protein